MSVHLAPHHRTSLINDSTISEQLVADRGYFTATTPEELAALGFAPQQLLVPSLVIPQHGVDGDIVGYQHRPDAPREKDGKTIKYESMPGAGPRIDVPPSIHRFLATSGTPLWITEGTKKADAAAVRGLCCISLPGVWNWRGSNSKGGYTELPDWDRISIKGRVVYIVFDSDVMLKRSVLQALRRLSAMLKRRGAASVCPLVIPSPNGEKIGLDDFLAKGGTQLELQEFVNETLLRPVGIITNNRGLAEISTDALNALIESNIPPVTFVRAGELVRVNVDERGLAKISHLSHAALRGILARSASFVRMNKESSTEVSPPADVVEDIMSLGHWADPDDPDQQIPPIEAITRAPVLTPGGTISTAPGYCPLSRFYIATRDQWPEWTGTPQSAAQFLLDDVLADFPFAGDSDRAHALALMLLPIVRATIDGPTPLHLIDAPVQGTGKSLLGKVCLMPTCGDKIGATTGTRDEEEWRKKIASALLEGRTYVFLDNLSRKVDSDSLAGVLTSTEWNDRALSTMTNINVPVRCAWVATANNAELSRDILRRTAWIRLDAGVERPEDRKNFRHPNIEPWVSENRPRIISALCAMVRAWSENGMPVYQGRYLGSFEEWSKTIGGILYASGVNGFLGNIDQLRAAAGSDETSWSDFYGRWFREMGDQALKASSLLYLFEQDEALSAMLGDKGENSRKMKLGHLLKRQIGVVRGGYRVVKANEWGGSQSFALEKVSGLSSAEGDLGQKPTKSQLDDLGSNEGGLVGFSGLCGLFTDPHAHDHAHASAHTHARNGSCESPQSQLKPTNEAALGSNSLVGFASGGEKPTNKANEIIDEVEL